MRHTTKLLVLAVAILGALGIAGAGWAYWTTSGSGSASATVGTLNPPTIGTTTQPTVGVGTLRVNWTASTGTPTPSGYYVQRFIGSTLNGAACASSPSSLIPAPSCDDTGLTASGPYNYKVTAVFRSWTAQSGASNSISVVLDTTPPSVTVTQAAGQADPTKTVPVHFTAAFSEPVNALPANGTGVVLGGTANHTSATIAVTTTDSSHYDIAVSGLTGDGTITASLNAAATTDLAGNKSLASTSTDNLVTYDTTAPSVTVNQKAGQADPTKTLPILYTVTFSEPVTGFDATDLTRSGTSTGGTVALSGSGASYEISVSGAPTNGTLIFTVAASAAQDAAGNNSLASTSTDNTVTYDTTAPTGSITVPAAAANVRGASVTVSSDSADAGSGVASAQFQSAPHGGTTFSSLGGADTTSPYSVTWDTTSGYPDGQWDLRVVTTDAAGNTFTSPVTTVTVDNTAPTVSIVKASGQADPTNALPINYTVTFSESVTGFTNSGLTLGGTSTGTKSAVVTGSGTTYNVAVSGATSTGTVTASVNAGAGQDAAGNANTASPTTVTVNYDITAPTVTINQAAGQADPSNIGTVNFTVTFSESVTGFTSSDVTIGGTAGGTKSAAVTGTGTTYNVAVSGATGNGTIIATVPVNAAQDTAGNNSAASTSTDNTVTLDTTAPTASSVSTSNGGSTAGLPEQADTVTLTYSEQIDPATVLAGWSGSATNIVVRATDGGSANDTLTFFNSANNTQLPLGSLDLGSKTYFTGNVTFGASGTASSMSAVTTAGKTVLTITFGTVSDATKTHQDSPNNKSVITWTPSSAVTDLAGNAVNTATPVVTANTKEF